MKILKKRVYSFVVAFIVAISVLFSSGIIFCNVAFAVTNSDYAYKYYYSQIENNEMAKKFYTAFENLLNSGAFKKGKIQYDLISNKIVTQNEVDAYVNGVDNNRLSKAYGIGRDAFYMDHPDLFYADVFSTSISAGGKNGKNVAYLDSSRVLTMYNGSINSESAVNNAIERYNNEIATIVTEAQKKSSIVEKIEYVNTYISQHNTYGFGTKVEGDRNVDTDKVGYIHSAYGALVNNESVCEGYAKSFKAVMDRLNIPCVCVQGYADGSKDGNYEPHMWNYVQVDGMWYLVDVTYNATSGQNKWVLVGEQFVYDTHIEDGSVSSSGYKLNYPALKPYNYGTDLDENGMTILGSYESTDYGKNLELLISYDGKGAVRLENEGKYLAYRLGTSNDNTVKWSNWMNVVAVNNAMKDNIDGDYFLSTDYDTKVIVSPGTEYIQFVIFNKAPDIYGDPSDLFTRNHIVRYDENNLTESNYIIQPTAQYRNNGYGSYVPSPAAVGFYPANTGTLPVDQTYDIRVVYTDDLVLKDGYDINSIELNIESSHGNSTIKDEAKIENFKWDGARTITFKFTPSKMYIHNSASCYFTPIGLVGKKSGKDVDPFTYSFKGKSVVCSKIFNDGRLYMNVFGAPSLLDNSDLSVTDFKDENGKYFAESQRSQLLLVATKPSNSKVQEMEGLLKEDMDIKDNEIVTSSTYEINLQICGVVQKVPNGSYMQVAFGFPEGYDKDDAGTTFKIYHYKHDASGNITGVEEIPAIITEYGLIAKVTSFSPFTIVQIKNTSAAVTNSKTTSVYAYVNGNVGGTITTAGNSGISQVSGNSITYDIKADNGYTIGCVRLNGKVLDSSNYANGKLTLNKNEIDADNMLEVVFVSKEAADNYASNGVTLSFGNKFVPNAPVGGKGNGGVIAICCILAVLVIAAGGVAVWWFFIKNKPATATAGSKNRNSVKAKTNSNATKKNGSNVTKNVANSNASNIKTLNNSNVKNSPVNTNKQATSKNNNAKTNSKNLSAGKTKVVGKTNNAASKTTASKPATTSAKSNTNKKPATKTQVKSTSKPAIKTPSKTTAKKK